VIGGHAQSFIGEQFVSLAVSRPYLRSRPYSCVRVSPSRLRRDLLRLFRA